MKPLVRRGLVILGWTIGIGFVAIAGFVVWLAGTTPGLRFAIGTGASRAPMTVTVDRIEGRIWGSMRLGGVDVVQDATRLHLDSVELDWNPSSLFARRLHVHRLVLDGIAVTLGPPQKKPPPDPNAALPEIELPVLVQMDTVRFRNIVLRQAGRPDSLGIAEIALDGLQYRDSLGVQRFALATPWGELGFRGWVRTRGQYPLDVAFQWSLMPPDLPRIVGAGALTGDLDTLTIRQRVTAPARVELNVRLEKLLSHPRFDATARLEPLDLATIRKDLPRLTVAGTLDARGDLERQRIGLAGSFASREYGSWTADAHAEISPKAVELSRLVVARQGRPGRITASGRASLDSTRTSFELLAGWSEVAWPPVGDAFVTLPRGDLTLAGEPAGWRLDMKSDVRTPKGIQESLRVTGHGDSTRFVLESLAGSLLGGTVDATGRVGWSPRVTWNLDASVRALDAGLLVPPWPSSIAAHLRTEGSWSDSTWTARFDLDDCSGELRGKPIAGRVQFHGRSDTTSLIDAEVRYAGAMLTASGTALAPIGVEWKLDVPSLGELDSSLAGRLRGSGTLAGPDSVVHATVRLEGEELAAAGATVARLALDARLDRTHGNAVDLVAVARGIASPPLAPFDSVRVTVNGTPERYAFAGTVESALRRLALRGEAVLAADSLWTGRLDQFDLAVAENAPWSLVEPAPFEVSPARARVGPFALRAATAKLEANGEWSAAAGTRVDAALAGFPLANANAFLPEEYLLEGTLSMTARAHLRNDGVLDAAARLEPMAGKVTWRAAKAEPVEIPFEDLRLDLRSDAAALQVDGALELPDLGQASSAVNLPGFRWNRLDSTQVVNGTIRAQASKWEIVEKLSPDVRKLEGRLDADIKLAGTVAAPRASGVVRFEKGAFDLPAYGIEARAVGMTAQGDGNGKWTLASSMQSDPGRIAVNANADLSDATRPRATMRIEGERFKVIDTSEARILVSPDLDVRVEGPRVDVTGELTVPLARVDAGNRSLELAVPASKDVVVLREAPDSTALPIELHARVRLTLGEDVSFKGYGIKATPEGSLLITQEPDKPAFGQGELSLKSGTYTGYGRDLTIERGRLIYAGGPVDDPQVDIRAKREVDNEDVLVGFEVTGTLKQSQMSVFSDPEMTQADAISYLLFNRPIAEARSSESAIARETATSMGLQAGSAYTQKMASKIGLSEASLESEGTLQDAALMLGTYLTPSLYARYGIGLFDSANTFQLTYALTKHWKVEAETSEQNRAGIIYSIEP